jgi:hypothetical protein
VAQAPHWALSVTINLYKWIIINDVEECREYMKKKNLMYTFGWILKDPTAF